MAKCEVYDLGKVENKSYFQVYFACYNNLRVSIVHKMSQQNRQMFRSSNMVGQFDVFKFADVVSKLDY